ncbi:DUF5949 family protein [Streptomyces sp. C10-9-1]|uniref:DUF5949 family protein n=1 Tax=Streptomyces sp. C10-9-1 TaxID=1859285 RepID=UPI002112D00A|nr:DUF5949 family protein [Streptomyces sp. C10-9-1]MCQ6554582.1 DUF5949 family protein [Streptomyces sp. C10-9-1]
MTTANTVNTAVDPAELGTMVLLAWTGDPAEGHDTPYLVAYSLGDGTGGGEAARAAAATMIEELGLTTGDVLQDRTREGTFPVQLLIQAGQAVLTMPHMNAQCPAPEEWLAAAEERGTVHFMIAARPWPEARPGTALSEEVLKSFLGDEAVLADTAHVLLPVSRLRG